MKEIVKQVLEEKDIRSILLEEFSDRSNTAYLDVSGLVKIQLPQPSVKSIDLGLSEDEAIDILSDRNHPLKKVIKDLGDDINKLYDKLFSDLDKLISSYKSKLESALK